MREKVYQPSLFSEIYQFRFVLFNFISQFLFLRYKRTIAGYLWTILNPLLMMSATAVVFSSLFHMELKSYVIFILSGMIAFSFFSSVVTQSGQCLLGNESLIKKIYIPKIIFPLSNALGLFIDNAFTTTALLLIMIIIGSPLSSALFFLPIAYLLLFLFTFGFSLVMAVMTVYFRDLQHIMTVLMQVLLFLTPVLYKATALSGKVFGLIQLNPLTIYIDLFRTPLFLGEMPSVYLILKAVIFSCMSLLGGLWFFEKHQQRVVYRL